MEPQYKEKVRQHTLCALRAVEAAQALLSLTADGDAPLPRTIETPKIEPGLPSLHKLPEVEALLSDSRAELANHVQCYFGAETPTPTGFLGTMKLQAIPEKCKHLFVSWTIPWSGRRLRQPHPPSSREAEGNTSIRLEPKDVAQPRAPRRISYGAGREVPSRDQRRAGHRNGKHGDVGAWPTQCTLPQSAQAPAERPKHNMVKTGKFANALMSRSEHRRCYPGHHLHVLKHRLKAARERRAHHHGAPPAPQDDLGPNHRRDSITWKTPLRGAPALHAADLRRTEGTRSLGGMRNGHWAVQRIPGWWIVGKDLRSLAETHLDAHSGIIEQVSEATTGPKENRRTCIDEKPIESFRQNVADAFGGCSTDPVDN